MLRDYQTVSILLLIGLLPLFFACSSGPNDIRKYSPENDILTAVNYGKIDLVKEHIANGVDLNGYFVTKDHIYLETIAGAAALHIAVISPSQGNIATFKTITGLLLDAGASIELRAENAEEGTPLAWAAYFGKMQMVKFLVNRGAKINVKDKNGFTILDAASLSPLMDAEPKLEMQNYLKGKGAKSSKDN